jgi:molecular chaperone Hsp33
LSDNDRLGEVTVHRFLNTERTLAVAEGRFSSLFDAYREHVKRWELPLDGLSLTMMREGLAAVTLHLAARPPDESVGVTINVPSPPLNLFLTGDAASASVTGRAFTEAVKTADTGRMFVQAYRPPERVSQSTIDVSGLDVLGMFEDFYTRSEQNPAGLYELDEAEGRYVMVLALPDADPGRVESMNRDTARALVENGLTPLEDRVFRFRCGCNPDKILTALRQIFAADPEELFRGEPEVETFCPRCGARWWVRREEFEG